MNITIIGASAGVGLCSVKRALDLGHRVTVLSRREVAVEDCENLIRITGSALNHDDLSRAIEGADAILVTLGTGMKTSKTTLFSDFAKLIEQLHTEKLIMVPVIVLTGFGASESRPFLKTIMKPIFALILNKIYADKAVMERLITESSLHWEIVRPGLLTNKPLTERYRIETELFKGMNIGSISRWDVADFMVKEAVAQAYIGRKPALCHK